MNGTRALDRSPISTRLTLRPSFSPPVIRFLTSSFKTHPISVYFCLLLSFVVCELSGASLEIRPQADAYIRASQSPAQTQSATNALLFAADTVLPDDYLRSVLSFDLNHPALLGVTIDDVELVLTIKERDTSSGGSVDALTDIDLYTLTSDFVEAEADWSNRSSSVSWASPGGDLGSMLDRAQANPATVAAGDRVAFASPELTATVIGQLGSDMNLLLKLAVEDAVRSVFRFGSRSADFSVQPVLVIEYTDPNLSDEVVPVPGHPEQSFSSRYTLLAGGHNVQVKAERFSFDVAMFSMGEEPVEVSVDCASSFSGFTLKPDRYNIQVTQSGNRLSFMVDEPMNLVLQIPGRTPLAILVTPMETDVPSASDPDVLYFSPGIQDVGVIQPVSGQTIYFAPGALVKGRIEAKDVDDVRVCGRGILETAGYSVRADKTPGILFENCHRITVEGIGLRSYDTWWQSLYLNCTDVEVAQMNIFGVGVNTDGVDIDAVKDFVVRDSFIRCEDDGLGWHSLDAATNGEMITEDALAENLVIWNTRYGNGIRIGASMEAQLWRNITIREIDILEHGGSGIYSDYSDWAWMENLRFEDIVIERGSAPIYFYIGDTRYSNSTGYLDERGHMDGLVFENVRMNGGTISFYGSDERHRINNLRLNNCTNDGQAVTSLANINVNQWVTDIAFNEALTPYDVLNPESRVLSDLESSIEGGVQYIEDDPDAIKGRRRVYLGADIGDAIEHRFLVDASDRYHLKLQAWQRPDAASVDVYINGAFAGHWDLYAATEQVLEWDLGDWDLSSGQTHVLRLEVVGQHASSSGYAIHVDEFQVFSPLLLWRSGYFGSSLNSGNGADGQDPDRDGVANLFEFIRGTNPLVANVFNGWLQSVDGAFELQFEHVLPAALDVSFQLSLDLSHWETVAGVVRGSSDWSLEPGSETLWPGLNLQADVPPGGTSSTAKLGFEAGTEPAKVFYRIRAVDQ